MIIFSGKIENDIQSKVITKRGQFLGILGIIVAGVGFISCLIVWLIEKNLNSELIKILIFSSVCVLIYGIICIPTSRRRLKFVWDYYIKFENEIITVVSNHQNGVTQSYNISRVKKVVDYGRYYYLFLHRLDSSNGITCQKNLLIDGTIEEFEELFKGKIIHMEK